MLLPTNIGDTCIQEEYSAKFLGILIETDLSFQNHVYSLCKSAGRKISMMARIAKYLSTTKRKILMKTFFESLFNYCPLIWMFCGRSLNNKINVLHERALPLAYNDYTSSFETLLENDLSVSIHQKNLRCLATEMFKSKNKLASPFLFALIQESTSRHSTRSHSIITECEKGQRVNKVKKGIKPSLV